MIFARKPSPVKFKWHYWKPDDVKVKWLEEDIQSYIVMKLRDWQAIEPGLFEFEAGMEGIKLSIRAATKAKALGMGNGFTDLKFYLSRGRMCLIELKRKGGKGVSDNQIARHEALAMLGFTVYVVKAKTPQAGWEQVLAILKQNGV
jgi:hypothetical protein